MIYDYKSYWIILIAMFEHNGEYESTIGKRNSRQHIGQIFEDNCDYPSKNQPSSHFQFCYFRSS